MTLILCNIFINDLDDWTECILNKFVDDTRFLECRDRIQNDLIRLTCSCQFWGVRLNKLHVVIRCDNFFFF